MATVKPIERSEKTTEIQNLPAEHCFRFLGITFERAMEGDEGSNFYVVIGVKKEESIEVASTADLTKRRKLPADMVVVSHRYEIRVAPAEKV